MTTRELILSRVRAGLGDVPTAEDPGDVVVQRGYLRALDVDVVERFVERISEYKPTVRRVAHSDVPQGNAQQLSLRGLRRIAVPADLPDEWRPAHTDFVTGALDAPALDREGGAAERAAAPPDVARTAA